MTHGKETETQAETATQTETRRLLIIALALGGLVVLVLQAHASAAVDSTLGGLIGTLAWCVAVAIILIPGDIEDRMGEKCVCVASAAIVFMAVPLASYWLSQ